ncbi:MAG TPA: hypothetical protein VMI06_12360 [Terriglobia bacterium]|nr:hypothetical protein [Terriglobia bacterium]
MFDELSVHPEDPFWELSALGTPEAEARCVALRALGEGELFAQELR